jgi:hypothetical protein
METSSAHWIDFDTRHRAAIPVVARRADDFRALLWSCATCLEAQHYPRLIEVIFRDCPEGPVREALAGWMRSGRAPSVFELAQAPLSPRALASLREAFQSKR